MSHLPVPGRMYRMPYGFGPTCGPRQGPDGERFDWRTTPRKRTVQVDPLNAEFPDLAERLLKEMGRERSASKVGKNALAKVGIAVGGGLGASQLLP